MLKGNYSSYSLLSEDDSYIVLLPILIIFLFLLIWHIGILYLNEFNKDFLKLYKYWFFIIRFLIYFVNFFLGISSIKIGLNGLYCYFVDPLHLVKLYGNYYLLPSLETLNLDALINKWLSIFNNQNNCNISINHFDLKRILSNSFNIHELKNSFDSLCINKKKILDSHNNSFFDFIQLECLLIKL